MHILYQIGQVYQFYYYMKSNFKSRQINQINEILHKQKEELDKRHIFPDYAENQQLHNRINQIKQNYKYIQKIDRASNLIKSAKKASEYIIDKNRNQINKKYRIQEDESVHKQSKQIGHNSPQQWRRQQNNGFNNPEHQIDQQLNKSLQTNMRHMDQQLSYQRQNKNKYPSKQKNDTIINQINQSQFNKTQNKSQENANYEDQYNKQQTPKQGKEGIMNNKSLASIQVDIVRKYFQDKIKIINSQVEPDIVYKIINPFYELCGIKLGLPLIKKYKNCLFFGDSKDKNTQNKYEGFIIFYTEGKIYYGEMQMQKKHGFGVEMDFHNGIIYKGFFQRGRKSGKFEVIKSDEKYIGKLYKGKYHGQGQLQTKFSIYKGHFQNGQRHGEGQQKFTIMNLTLSGNFIHNKFSNKSQILQQNRLSTITNKSQQVYNQTNKNPNDKTNNLNLNSSKQVIQSTILVDKHDKIVDRTVSFENSLMKKQIYQQFNCAYGDQDQQQIDDIEVVKITKLPTFRIKQNIKSTPFSNKKRTISEEKSYIPHNK